VHVRSRASARLPSEAAILRSPPRSMPGTQYLVQAYKRLAALLRESGDTEGALDVLEPALTVHERAGRPIS
jgi:hypothetical protein